MLTISTIGGRFYHTLRRYLGGSRDIAVCISVQVTVQWTQPFVKLIATGLKQTHLNQAYL